MAVSVPPVLPAGVPSVLYEDNHLLVVEKPPNLPVQADSSGDADLLSILKAYIKEKYNKPGDVYLGLCHRLDRPVGGVMVFARTSKAAARLSAQFSSRQAEKRYIAVVEGAPPQSAALCDYLRAEEGEARVRVFPEPAPDAKQAKLSFRAMAKSGGFALLDISLSTGRKHQIRAQLSAHGWPIRFDQRYHPAPARGQIALWAYLLSFDHPTKAERMRFFAKPRGEAFAPFDAQVTGLAVRDVCDAVYADENILVAAKRAGVEVTIADGGENSLEALLAPHFGKLYPVHRLDANTEGLLLFARNASAEAELLEAVRSQRVEKYYQCLVRGVPHKRQDVLEAYSRKDAQAGKLFVYDDPVPGALPIKTGYRVLGEEDGNSLLEVRLYTGRTHQIRAHLAHIGHPVLGDDKYGDREANKAAHMRRQALLAARLTLHFEADSPLAYLDGKTFTCPWELALLAQREAPRNE